MLSVSLEKVGEEDIVDILFTREDSRRAARLFLGWLKDRQGRCSKPEMNEFSHTLASDKVLSRTNFYKTILHRFMVLGLIAEQLEYDQRKNDSVKVYRAVLQPIGKRRPISPSLTYLAHVVAEKWNLKFSGV